jgi:CRP-like cAMP-binding protein
VDNPVWAYVFGPPKDKRAVIELMQSLPAFEGLSQNELVTIERSLHQRNYSSGEKIFGEDMPGAGMYIIKEGEVAITKRISEEKEVELAVITRHNFFGEMALIDESPRSASAVANKDTVLLAFCQPDLENLKDRNPKVAAKIISNIARLICKRLVKANDNLEVLEKKITNHGVDCDK